MKAREKQQLETYLKGSEFKTYPEKDQQVLERALDRFRRNEQNANPVSLWRIIMKSPITRVAAVLLLVVGITVMSWRSPEGHSNEKLSSLTFLSLISTASAAEQALFTGDRIVHITHEITLYPNADVPDIQAQLDELIESNFTLDRNLAFMRAWFSSRASLPVHSLKADGEYQWHTLELAGAAEKESVVQEHIWYDPESGFFARAFMQDRQVIFAMSFDGQAVYLTEVSDNGRFQIQREPIAEQFNLPDNPAEFLGISASFQDSMDKMNLPPIEEQSREQLVDGTWVRVYQLRWPGTDAYHVFVVDDNDNTIEQIESVAYERPIQQIQRISSNSVDAPGFSWDLAELAGQSAPSRPEVIFTEGITTITPQEMADIAQVETYVLGEMPDWVKEQKFVMMSDKASSYGARYVVFCSTNDGRCAAISQGRTVNQLISGVLDMSNQAGLRWFPDYVSSNRFKVHDLFEIGRIVGAAILTAVSDFMDGDKLWSSDAIFKQGGFEPLPDNRIYMLHSPTDTYLSITLNGKFSDAEVHELIDKLIPARLYQSPDQAKDWRAMIDPGSVVYQGFEPGVFMKDWLVLGPIPVFGDDVSDADKFADGASQMAAFDENKFDIHTFEPVVSIDGKRYYWEKYSSGSEVIEFAWLFSYHGFADAYARAQIEMAEDTPVLLAIGDDDRIKVWLNGDLVHEDRDGGPLEVDKALVPVTLRKGLNDLLLKVQNGIFEWEFSFRIFEADYDPAADVKEANLSSVTYPGLVQGEFMKEWLLLGPIAAADGVPGEAESKAAFERDYLASLENFEPVVRIDDVDYKWAVHRSYTGIIDLRRFWGDEPLTEHVSCYAWAQVDMPEETEALLGFGTDDAGRAWLNGELILDSWSDRGAFPDHDRVKVTFKKGPNQLVIKVYNNLRNWKFCCRLLE
ncbi:MAG: hypothetical protein AMJ75_10850 [Phycisphaerae bacterium SM1_79]|nr:MAG: hypothetical protein AMJ75_10850 [Phycisphaerae bacterium SM1_79]